MLIHITLRFMLRFGTALMAACTVVKLQHPFRSTQSVNVVLVSGGGKFGGKSSQMDTGLLLSWCLRCRKKSLKSNGMNFMTIHDDEGRVRLKSINFLWKWGLGSMIHRDMKTAKIAIRIVKQRLFEFIVFFLWRMDGACEVFIYKWNDMP